MRHGILNFYTPLCFHMMACGLSRCTCSKKENSESPCKTQFNALFLKCKAMY